LQNAVIESSWLVEPKIRKWKELKSALDVSANFFILVKITQLSWWVADEIADPPG
jgi:hypothetical protein